MGDKSLIDNYLYGNKYPANYTLASDVLVDGPKRERQIIGLLGDQIAWNKKIGSEIIASNAMSAQIVSNEISSMTDSLNDSLQSLEYNISNTIESSMQNLGNQLSDVIYDAAGGIIDAIYTIGKQIGMELVEIKWQLEQQSKTMGEVLKLLYNNRSNEARQFVEQGVRHYLISEYEEAEERFKKALENDTTDYQALFNLGFIEIHKNNPEASFKYFNKALKLPKDLDKSLQEKTLVALARLHYTQKDYKVAFLTMKETLKSSYDNENAYKMAVYAGLAGEKEQLFITLDDLIDKDPDYFAKFATEIELSHFNKEITNSLEKRVTLLIGRILANLKSYNKMHTNISEYIDKVDPEIATQFNELDSKIRKTNVKSMKYEEILNFNYLLLKTLESEKEYEYYNLTYRSLEELNKNNNIKSDKIHKENIELSKKIKDYEQEEIKSCKKNKVNGTIAFVVLSVMIITSLYIPYLLIRPEFLGWAGVVIVGFFIFGILGWPVATIGESYDKNVVEFNNKVHSDFDAKRNQINKQYQNNLAEIVKLNREVSELEEKLNAIKNNICKYNKILFLKPMRIKISQSNMVLVEGGSFQMGSNEIDNAKPVHSVTLSNFYIGKYQVTQKEWVEIMDANPSKFADDLNKPVEQVRWYDTIVYCNKRSFAEKLTPYYSIKGSTNPDTWGKTPTSSNAEWDAVTCNWSANGYRLPTEAEWEFAARGGNKSHDYRYSGSDDLNSIAWHKDNSGDITHTVGGKLPNELGLYDMSGNIFEWNWDWYNSYTGNALNNPRGSTNGTYRVSRGGYWGSSDDLCRVADRRPCNPFDDHFGLGFRLARNY